MFRKLFLLIVLLFFSISIENGSLLAQESLQVDNLIKICHQSPGNSLSYKTISVYEDEVADHLAHGDAKGACPVQSTTDYVCEGQWQGSFTRLFVQSGTIGRQKGTPEDPFHSLQAALAYAAKKDYPAVELQIGPGHYAEGALSITRDTRVVGPGTDEVEIAELALSFSHLGNQFLGIQGVKFINSGTSATAAVQVGGADTAMCDVVFDGINGHAISQTGGRIWAENIDVRSTRPHPQITPLSTSFLSGTAILLFGGVDAVLRQVEIKDSASSGLAVQGLGTRVFVTSGKDSENNTIRSRIVGSHGCRGAIWVSRNAFMLGEGLDLGGDRSLAENLFSEEDANRMGLFVSDGAQAHFRDVFISNTREQPNPETNCDFSASGIAVSAVNAASLQLSDFVLTHSDFIGLYIGQNGLVRASNIDLDVSYIKNNYIGLVLNNSDLDLECVSRNVVFLDNVVNLDSPSLPPLPPLCGIHGDECEPPPTLDELGCPVIPFEPNWAAGYYPQS